MSIESEKNISNNNIDTNLIKISKEDISNLETTSFDGRIIVIQSKKECSKQYPRAYAAILEKPL